MNQGRVVSLMGGDGAKKAARKWLRRLKIGAGLALIVLVLIVIFQNFEPATFDVLFWQAELPRVLLLLVTFGVGAVAGGFALRWLRKKRG